jgi:hypothetical protein
MKVESIYKRAFLTLALLGLLVTANAQNTVNGRIQTVHPDTSAGHAGLTFSKNGLMKYIESDSLDGTFSTDLPSGTYDLTVKVKDAYIMEKQIDVSGPQSLLIQPINYDSVKYEYSMWPEMFDDNLKELWAITGTHPLDDNHILHRWNDEDLPLETYCDNIPEWAKAQMNYVVSNIANRTIKNKIVEVPKVQAKAKWFFVTHTPNFQPAETWVHASVKDGQYHMDSADVYIDTSKGFINTRTIFKEWGRVWLLQDLGPPEWVFSPFSTATEFHPAEYRALNTMYLLENYTDMFQYKDTVAQTITGIKESSANLPTGFTLSQNFPNPFNPNTIIRYTLPENLYVTLKVYNSLGEQVATVVNEKQNAGQHEVLLKCSNLTSGVYYYHIRAGEFMETKKIVLLK